MGVMARLPMLFGGSRARLQRAGEEWEAQEDASGAILASPTRRFEIERQPKAPSADVAGVDEYPWYVQETTHGDDRDDYGRMESYAGAVALVGRMMNGERYGLAS